MKQRSINIRGGHWGKEAPRDGLKDLYQDAPW
jgi:hypothetical protein